MIESWAIRLEMGILLFASVLFPNLLPALSFFEAEIQYGGIEKKDAKKIAFFHDKSLF